MSELHKALEDISSIRRQVAERTEFRGYGPATLTATGALAVVAAALQALWIPVPLSAMGRYLSLWIATAALACGLSGVQMVRRSRRMHSGISNEMLRMAVEQFLPAFVAGSLCTLVIARNVPNASWMLPGLWQLIFGLGVFASCRFLPKPMLLAGAWYVLVGLICLSLGDARALSPWSMGVAFGAGECIIAAVLYCFAEGKSDE